MVDKGELTEFIDGETVTEQGECDTCAYFLITGHANVFINNRDVGTRTAGELIGEMVTVDVAQPRSATIKASGGLLALRVQSDDLEAIANQNPLLWRSIARVACSRLRARNRFHRPQNDQPIIFVGSSAESIHIAREFQESFKHDQLRTVVWTNGVFGPGGVPIDDLLREVTEADFAVFIFCADDVVRSRESEQNAPRDNVIFELGLFMGKLGRERTFMLMAQNSDLKIPSDLLGVTPVTYIDDSKKPLSERLAPACNELRKYFEGLGAL